MLRSWQVQATFAGASCSEQDTLTQRVCSCKASSVCSSHTHGGVTSAHCMHFKSWATVSLPLFTCFLQEYPRSDTLKGFLCESAGGVTARQWQCRPSHRTFPGAVTFPSGSCSSCCALCCSNTTEPPKLRWDWVLVMGVEVFAEVQYSDPRSVYWDTKFLEAKYLSVLFSWQNVLIKESHLAPT